MEHALCGIMFFVVDIVIVLFIVGVVGFDSFYMGSDLICFLLDGRGRYYRALRIQFFRLAHVCVVFTDN